MPRYTTAYSSFAAQLKEVYLLRRRAAALEKKNAVGEREEINALCRAAIVLLSAKLENYIRELGDVALTSMHTKAVPRESLCQQFYYHISKNILDEIRETADPARVAGKVFSFLEADLPYWSHTGPFPEALPGDRFNKGFANPKVDKINAYLRRFGYEDYKKDLGRALKSKYPVTVNMVDHLVDVRNKIAHGDPASTKTPADLKAMIRITQDYCGATDRVFGAWCRANLCSIR